MSTVASTDPLLDAPDASLVVLARRDRAAFRPLYERYFVSVYRIIRFRVTSDDDALELTQDVFTQAMTKLNDLRQPERFKFWLLRIAYNRRNDYLRAKQQQGQSLPLDADAHFSPDPSVEEQVIRDEETRRLYNCLPLLTADQQEVLRLRLEGRDTQEIAAFLGCSPDAVKQRQWRALVRLRELLKEVPRG